MARQTCGLNAGTHLRIVLIHIVVVDFTSVEIHHAALPRQTPRIFDDDTAALTAARRERSKGCIYDSAGEFKPPEARTDRARFS